MLENLENLDGPVLQQLLRRTVASAAIVGGIAVVVCLMIAPPFATVGLVLGLGLALLNLRRLDAGVAKVEETGEGSTKVVKKMLRTNTAARLGIITVIAVGLLFVYAPIGVGMVVGLVIFQILFVANVARVVFSQGGVA